MGINEYFSSRGLVYGNYWGGGKGAFASKKLKGFTSKEELIKRAEEMLKDGSLDGGMGYESLIGAGLIIEKVKSIQVEEEEYTNYSEEIEYIGNMTPEEIEFLENHLNCF
jgi:hypothetical protein